MTALTLENFPHIKVERPRSRFFFRQKLIDDGKAFVKGQALFSFTHRHGQEGSIDEEELEFSCNLSGFILKYSIKDDEEFFPQTQLMLIAECDHGVTSRGLCTKCGKEVSDLQMEQITFGHREIAVTPEEAAKIDGEKEKTLLLNRKLTLILDLDHTLIHATTRNAVQEKPDINGIDTFEFYLPQDPVQYYVKFRPGLCRFLEDMWPLYDLFIYTKGTRQYANQIADLMDPDRQYFTSHHIIARDDFPDSNKNLQRIFPCKDHMAVIIDDRQDVWTDAQGQVSKNLIPVDPYHYFDSREELNAMPNDDDRHFVNREDSVLESLNHILRRVHKEFYSYWDRESEERRKHPHVETPSLHHWRKQRDVKVILSRAKAATFVGCNIAFSGVIPVNIDPHSSNEWKMAESFGAKCQTEITDHTTHLVARMAGTAKVNAAVKVSGLYVVSLQWFTDSVQNWNRQPEIKYPLPKTPVILPNSIPRIDQLQGRVAKPNPDNNNSFEPQSENLSNNNANSLENSVDNNNNNNNTFEKLNNSGNSHGSLNTSSEVTKKFKAEDSSSDDELSSEWANFLEKEVECSMVSTRE